MLPNLAVASPIPRSVLRAVPDEPGDARALAALTALSSLPQRHAPDCGDARTQAEVLAALEALAQRASRTRLPERPR